MVSTVGQFTEFIKSLCLSALVFAQSFNAFSTVEIPKVSVDSAEYDVNELSPSLSVSAHLSVPNAESCSVEYRLAAPDGLVTASGTIQFAPGESVKTVSIATPPDDSVPGSDRALELRLLNPAGIELGDLTTSTVRIIENDVPGGVDPAFNSDPNSFSKGRAPVAAVRQSDGSFIVIPDNSQRVNGTRLAQLKRIKSDGNLDVSFVTPNLFYTEKLVVDRQDRIVFVSQEDNLIPTPAATLGRLRADGTLDLDFQTNVLSGQLVLNILPSEDGSVLLGRSAPDFADLSFSSCLQLFDTSGASVPFAQGSKFHFGTSNPFLGVGGITALARDPEGNFLVGGTYTTIDGSPTPGLARLKSDGTVDRSFAPAILAPFQSDIRVIYVQSDGKILLGGAFVLPGQKTVCHMVRLNADGAIDSSFTQVVVSQTTTVSFTDPAVWQIIPSEGELFIRGPFNKVQGETHMAVARLHLDGSVDSSFNTARYMRAGPFSPQISSMVLDEPRGLLLVGNFNSFDYAPRTNLVRVFTQAPPLGSRQSQTITFEPIPDQTFSSETIPLLARCSSGLPVQFRVISGQVSVAHDHLLMVAAGPVTIEATQSGNDSFNPAPAVQQSFTIQKAGQTIAFAPIFGLKYLAGPVQLVATASSGLAVGFEVVSGPGYINPLQNTKLTARGAGVVTVRAMQVGDARYAGATVEQTVIAQKATQEITFNPPTEVELTSGVLGLEAFSSLGFPDTYPVTLEVLSGPATLEGANLVFHSSGLVIVRATQPGDDNAEPAPPVERTITVFAPVREQSIFFPPFSDTTFGIQQIPLLASASSGLPVRISVLAGNAIVSGAFLTINGAGQITLVAEQEGNAEFRPASPVSRSFSVAKASQKIDFSLPESWRQGFPVPLTAKTTSGLPVSFSVLAGNATLALGQLTIESLGTATVTAEQPGSDNYLPADPVQCSIEIVPILPSVTVRSSATGLILSWGKAYQNFVLEESGSVGSDWSRSSGDTVELGDTITVELPFADASRFFRLAAPFP